MPYDRHLIAPIDKGLQTNREPFLIPENAFSKMRNAYVYRDRVVKRFGSGLMIPANPRGTVERRHLQSRFRENTGQTVTGGNVSGTVNCNIRQIGQAFSVGDVIFTVVEEGTPGNMIRTDGVNATQEYNTTTGAFNITNINVPDGTPLYFYPALPVMGFANYEQTEVNDEQIIGFDRRFAYTYEADGWERAGTKQWDSSDSDFFWSANWRGDQPNNRILLVTNYVQADGIQYWNGANWTRLQPNIRAGGPTLDSARIVIPFKDRLIALNVIQSDGTFKNRCRFSQNGTPFDANNAWREDIIGKGGYVDAPTNQAIVSAKALKDRLIVEFERKHLELVYTGNQVLPFVWQEINSELGVESTFSTISFDNAILGIADVGVHACTGTSVQRIDENIPDLIFKIHNQNQGLQRVQGIREYFTEMAYWSYPEEGRTDDQPWPNKILGYNYVNRTWSINDDSITAFGYYQVDTNMRWSNTTTQWRVTHDQWNSGLLQANTRKVIAGNQEGYTFLVEPFESRNAPSLQITNIAVNNNYELTITAVDHNLEAGDFVLIENITDGPEELNGQVVMVDGVNNKDAFTAISSEDTTNDYRGGGTLSLVSRIDIETKDYNFYLNKGRRSYLQKTDFLVDRTTHGELTVSFFTDTSGVNLEDDSLLQNVALGNFVLDTYPYDLYPYEETRDILWHPVYFQADGSFFRLRLHYTDEQMENPNISLAKFRLHAMMFHTMPTSQRLG